MSYYAPKSRKDAAIWELIFCVFTPFGCPSPVCDTVREAGRTVENGFYINEIPAGSLGDVSSDPHMREIPYPEADKITFFIYEEILSCKNACNTLGLTGEDVQKIFYQNSANIFGI